MKIGVITKPNQKGQIVIPKEFRDQLGIKASAPLNLIIRGRGIYVYPILEVITAAESESSYLKVLERTQGSWAGEDWTTLRAKRRKIELKASKQRKQPW